MRPYLPGAQDDYTRFPRVSGDAPQQAAVAHLKAQFSPRERGCAPVSWLTPQVRKVFPA